MGRACILLREATMICIGAVVYNLLMRGRVLVRAWALRLLSMSYVMLLVVSALSIVRFGLL